jgi:hypothetical protein
LSAKINAAEIRKKYEDLEKEKLLDELVDREVELEKLKRKLRKYENPHTPSSKQGFEKVQAQGIPVGRKPGKEYHYTRTTRPRDTPNSPPVMVTATCNPSNGNTNIVETGFHKERIITDFTIEKIVTAYTVIEYRGV